jgi:GNAT superfamily N-acetyltransferase
MGLDLRHYDAAQARERFDHLVAVYLEVYAGSGDPFFGEDRYREQLSSHLTGPGFELVAAYDEGELVGYVYGFALPEGARWWRGLLTPVPPELIVETGTRTFGLCEIMVRPAWQGRGIGRVLHDELLRGRNEERATLLVEPDNPARHVYLKWGWHKLGELRPSWEGAPTYDAMLRPL